MNENEPKLSEKFFEKTIVYFLAGLGFVAALAWNDAVQSLFHELFGATPGSLVAKFGYAVIITLIVTIVSWRVGRAVASK